MLGNNPVRVILMSLLLMSQNSYAQECDVEVLFKGFKKEVQYHLSKGNGVVTWDYETEEAYYLLMSACSVESLVKYVEDSIPFIRSKIFSGIAQKHAEDSLLTAIYSKHQSDTAEYSESQGVVISYTVAEQMRSVIKWRSEGKLAQRNFKQKLEEIRSRPRVIIPGAYRYTVPKDSLLVMKDSLTCSVGRYRIISFRLEVGNQIIYSNNCFTKEVRRALKRAKPGEKLFIEEIKAVVMEDNRILMLVPISLKII